MKKTTAIIIAIIMVAAIIGLVGFCVMHMMQTGFVYVNVPALIGSGVVGLIIGIKAMRKRT